MNKTENFQLNQWDSTDRIMMEDFNADNQKIEQALNLRNCRIEYGTYTGTGTYGYDTPNTLTFSGKPLVVLIGSHSHLLHICMLNGTYLNPRQYRAEVDQVTTTWTDNSVSWHDTTGAEYQGNLNGIEYSYFALLEA